MVAYLLAPRVNWVPLQHPGYAAYSQPYTQLSVIPLRSTLDASGFLYYAWIIPYTVLVLVIGLIYISVVATCPRCR